MENNSTSGVFILVYDRQGRLFQLRPIAEKHLAQTRMWANDSVLQHCMCRSSYVSADDQGRWFQKLNEDSSCIVFAIEEAKSQRHVGNTGLYSLSWEHKRAEFWIVLAPEAQAHGLGSAVTKSMLHYAFRTCSLNRVEALVRVDNHISMRLFLRSGFIQEGLLREHHQVHGYPVDMVILSFLARQFRE